MVCGFPHITGNKCCGTGPKIYRPYRRRLESLTICSCHTNVVPSPLPGELTCRQSLAAFSATVGAYQLAKIARILGKMSNSTAKFPGNSVRKFLGTSRNKPFCQFGTGSREIRYHSLIIYFFCFQSPRDVELLAFRGGGFDASIYCSAV